MAEAYQKKELLALMATGPNKLCIDCNAPSPQWASVSYGTFMCLECSGVHRGFGVHISFIRSITMDKWSEDQFKKMKLGGNEKFKTFMESYGPEGGYAKGMAMKDKYHCWAAAQYREKLSADAQHLPTPWSPSSPPANFGVPSRPASSQATRKSRATAGASSLGPSSRSSTQLGNAPPAGQGSGNEAFFERMGNANASRPDHLPPSQGGRYAGFGSTPEPSGGGGGYDSGHPSYGTSSHAIPSLNELQSNPLGALSKGWGLFSSAVRSSADEINRSVVQPGMARASEFAREAQGGQRAGMYSPSSGTGGAVDPMASAATGGTTRGVGAGGGGGGGDWESYLRQGLDGARAAGTWAGQRAGEGWSAANELAKTKGGVDLNEQLGKMGLGGGGGGGGGSRTQGGGGGGYGQLARAEDGKGDDFFDSWDDQAAGTPTQAQSKPLVGGPGAKAPSKKAETGKKDGWDDDEWKDF